MKSAQGMAPGFAFPSSPQPPRTVPLRGLQTRGSFLSSWLSSGLKKEGCLFYLHIPSPSCFPQPLMLNIESLSGSVMFVGLLHCFLYPLSCQLDVGPTAVSKEYGRLRYCGGSQSQQLLSASGPRKA